MQRTSKPTVALILTFVALFAVVTLYAGSYLALGSEVNLATPTPEQNRLFNARWVAMIYLPAAWIESQVREMPVHLWYTSHPFSSTLIAVP
jgi:hypothetical protein